MTPGSTPAGRAQGFKTFERKVSRIGTQQFITLESGWKSGRFRRNLGDGAGALIETSNASTGEVLDKKALDTLPAPGRKAFMMARMVPTVIPIGDPQFNRQQDQSKRRSFRSAAAACGPTTTCSTACRSRSSGRAVLIPTIEAIDEVKIQVHTYDAEMGRTGGGVFNTTAKSGTNEFHGSARLPDPAVWGQSEELLQRSEAGQPQRTGRDCQCVPRL